MATNAGDRRAGASAKQPSLLAGLVYDGQGHRMNPTHAVKAGKRYRYYISRPLVSGARAKAPGALRIPAAEVEQIVCDRIRTWLADAGAVFDVVSTTTTDTEARGGLMAQAAELARSWPDLPTIAQRRILSMLVSRIEVCEESITLHLIPARLGVFLEGGRDDLVTENTDNSDATAPTLALTVAVQLQRIEKSGRLIIQNAATAAAQPNEPLIRLLTRAHDLQQALLRGSMGSLEALAAHADLSDNRLARLIRLSWLSPDITQAILRGQQPPSLTADKLARMARIPMDWQAQRAALGFS